MERPPRSRGTNIFKYLPKAATFAIRNRLYSPRRGRRPEHLAKAKAFHNKAFSGPIIFIVPEEARGRKAAAAAEAQEPTSPKVSCMGQIKHQKKKSDRRRSRCSLKKMFRRKVQPRRNDAVAAGGPEGPAVVAGARAPGIGQMRRFTSGRESLSRFDWRAAQRRGVGYDDDEEEEEEVIVPHSAPILMGGGLAVEPKKELNIWKRRTLAPPIPLQLN